MERKLILAPEFAEFAEKQNSRTQAKLEHAYNILSMSMPIPAKFVKKLVNTPFYELRVSVDNEIRVVLFAIDHENINLASRVILLNGFIKKSTKDYDREIIKAQDILNKAL